MVRRLGKIDPVCLWVNTTSLEVAIATARDLRSCTKTVLVGPTFFLAHGTNGIRCFYELGITSVILDVRLLGSPKEIWQCVSSASKHGARAISISSLAGPKNIQYAVEAAEASRQHTKKIVRPRILVSVLPGCVTDADMVDNLRMRVKRPGHIETAARHVLESGADGIIIEYGDMKYVKRVDRKIPMLVYAQRKARNYKETLREDEQELAGITEIMAARGSHVIMDSTLLARTDVEWAADMINKELDTGAVAV